MLGTPVIMFMVYVLPVRGEDATAKSPFLSLLCSSGWSSDFHGPQLILKDILTTQPTLPIENSTSTPLTEKHLQEGVPQKR